MPLPKFAIIACLTISRDLLIARVPPSGYGPVDHVSWEECTGFIGRRRRTKSGEALRPHFTRFTSKLSNQLGEQILADVPYNCWAIFPLFDLSCRDDFTGFAIAVVVPNHENKCEDDEREDGEDARKECTVGTTQ